MVSALLGVLATACFVLHLPWAGAVLTHAASVLDGTDGEIARLKRLDSPFGGFFDAVLDRYTDSLIMLGLLYFALTSESIRDALGPASEPVVLSAGMLAVSGTWLVSYTTTKASADLGHRYDGAWIGGGQGRDIRLLIVTIAGLGVVLYPIAAVAGMARLAEHHFTPTASARSVNGNWTGISRPGDVGISSPLMAILVHTRAPSIAHALRAS